MQLVVFDQLNASRPLAAFDIDASVFDVTVVDGVIDKPPHGRCAFRLPNSHICAQASALKVVCTSTSDYTY